MTLVKVSSKNQVVIPKEAREHAHIGPGDELLVIPRRSGGLLFITRNDLLESLKGSAKGTYGNVDEYLRKERASWEESGRS